jgi:hypothetical protein
MDTFLGMGLLSMVTFLAEPILLYFAVCLSSGLPSRSVRALASRWPVRAICWNDSEIVRRESEEWKLLILPKCKIN